MKGRLAQCVLQLATGWTVRGSNSGRGDIFHTLVPAQFPVKLVPGHFRWVKQPGHNVIHTPSSSDEVKNSLELSMYWPSVPFWQVMGWTSVFFCDDNRKARADALSHMQKCLTSGIVYLSWWIYPCDFRHFIYLDGHLLRKQVYCTSCNSKLKSARY